MIPIDFSGVSLKLQQTDGVTRVFDPVRRKWLVLTPEEHVRQYLLQYLCNTLHYPAARIAVEKAINVGVMNKRYDIVVYDHNHQPWMLIECKAPEVEITERTLQQLLAYHSAVPCRYWVLSNGIDTFCADAQDYEAVKWLGELPVING